MTGDKVDILGGILKEAGYRSGSAFLERYKRAHIEDGGGLTDQLRLQFKGALRAATRGLGPSRRAEAFSLQALHVVQDADQAVTQGGPAAPGRFATIGTWWLLREIEVSLLRLGQVLDSQGLVTLDLSATKTDPAGRGMKRAHRCICRVAAQVELPCPACAARRQFALRRSQGAPDAELLFADQESGAVSKHAAVETLRALLPPEGPGRICGHSMRRTGAQVLTASGVEPWLVEWFGRWGSSAVRAYIEDARARAPEVAGLVARVQAAILATGAGAGEGAQQENARSSGHRLALEDVGSRRGAYGPRGAKGGAEEEHAAEADVAALVRTAVAEFMKSEEEQPAYVRNEASGIAHMVLKATTRALPQSWQAICGWQFGGRRQRPARVRPGREDCPGPLCSKCRARAARLGLAVEAGHDDAEALSEADCALSASCSSEESSSSSA